MVSMIFNHQTLPYVNFQTCHKLQNNTRQVLERVRQSPFLVTLHYAFQTDAKLHLILGDNPFIHSCKTAIIIQVLPIDF